MTAERQLTDPKHVKIKYRPREQFRSFHNRKQRWSSSSATGAPAKL